MPAEFPTHMVHAKNFLVHIPFVPTLEAVCALFFMHTQSAFFFFPATQSALALLTLVTALV